MTYAPYTDPEMLIDEITRYLAAVDVFRAAGCEPAWRPEPAAIAFVPEPPTRSPETEKSAH